MSVQILKWFFGKCSGRTQCIGIFIRRFRIFIVGRFMEIDPRSGRLTPKQTAVYYFVGRRSSTTLAEDGPRMVRMTLQNYDFISRPTSTEFDAFLQLHLWRKSNSPKVWKFVAVIGERKSTLLVRGLLGHSVQQFSNKREAQRVRAKTGLQNGQMSWRRILKGLSATRPQMCEINHVDISGRRISTNFDTACEQ